MPWLWIPPRGKLGIKSVFSLYYEDGATTYYDRAFFLKLQRNNRKNALTVDPSRGKLEKKLYFLPHCGDGTTAYHDRALFFACVNRP